METFNIHVADANFMRKGQAALEFLTTYGWAILALLIVLGILVGSGMLSPTYFISEECNFGNNLGCTFALYNAGGATTLSLKIHNSFPYAIKIKEIQIQTQDGSQQFSSFGPGADLESGATTQFTSTLLGDPIEEGTAKRFAGNITYVSCAPELGGCSDVEHTLTGRVVGKVIPQ